MLHVTNSNDFFHMACRLWSSTAWSVRLVVAFVSYSERSESSELKEVAEANLLFATACLYKLGADKACHCWSFKVKCKRTATSITEFKSYLTLTHGSKEATISFGFMKFSAKIPFIDIRELQFLNRRTSLCTTQDEWPIIGTFLVIRKATNWSVSTVCTI